MYLQAALSRDAGCKPHLWRVEFYTNCDTFQRYYKYLTNRIEGVISPPESANPYPASMGSNKRAGILT